MSNKAPTSKVTAAGTGAGAAIVLVWLAGLFGLEMPAEVAAGIVGIVSFVAGYLKTERVAAGTGKHVATDG